MLARVPPRIRPRLIVDSPRTGSGAVAPASFPPEIRIQLPDQPTHRGDRIQALFRRRSVGRLALDFQLEPSAALVGVNDRALRGLPDDRECVAIQVPRFPRSAGIRIARFPRT